MVVPSRPSAAMKQQQPWALLVAARNTNNTQHRRSRFYYPVGTFFCLLLGISLVQLRMSLLHDTSNDDAADRLGGPPEYYRNDEGSHGAPPGLLRSLLFATNNAAHHPVVRKQMADSSDLYYYYHQHANGDRIAETETSRNMSSETIHHRVVWLGPTTTEMLVSTAARKQQQVVMVPPLSEPCPTCGEQNSDNDPALLYPFERPFYEECVPMMDWQRQSFPNCNTLHETSVDKAISVADDDNTDYDDDILSLLSLEGSWRSVWRLHRPFTDDTVVLKLLRYPQRKFDHLSYEHHRVDALAMERLTKSPYIVDIFGYCGQSVLTEYATGLARTMVKNLELHSLERLEIGRDMARAVADLHSIDYDGASNNATLVHNDMNMANAVEVNGKIKLNDFNIAILQRWNTTSNSICRAPVRFAAPLWKSPEENRNASYVDAAATDVYGLGNLLFHVLTKRQPWTHLEPNGPLTPEQAAQKKIMGEMPFVPEKYTADGTKKQALKALYHATMECFRTDPELRPTAHSVATRLDQMVQVLKKID